MKKFSFYLVALVVLAAFMQSCTIAKVGGRGAVPLILNQPAQQMELVEHVTIKKNKVFDYTNSFDVSELLAKEIAAKKPDAAINVHVTIKSSIDTYFINLFTFGLANATKVVVEADFMKEKKSATSMTMGTK
jgi:hypothetical protein